MSDYGITPQGWQSKRLADVIDEASVQLAEIVDPKTGNRLNPILIAMTLLCKLYRFRLIKQLRAGRRHN